MCDGLLLWKSVVNNYPVINRVCASLFYNKKWFSENCGSQYMYQQLKCYYLLLVYNYIPYAFPINCTHVWEFNLP